MSSNDLYYEDWNLPNYNLYRQDWGLTYPNSFENSNINKQYPSTFYQEYKYDDQNNFYKWILREKNKIYPLPKIQKMPPVPEDDQFLDYSFDQEKVLHKKENYKLLNMNVLNHNQILNIQDQTNIETNPIKNLNLNLNSNFKENLNSNNFSNNFSNYLIIIFIIIIFIIIIITIVLIFKKKNKTET